MEKVDHEEGLPIMLAERPNIDPRRLITVGLVGAVASMAIYYFYNMLHDDTKQRIQEQVASMIKVGIQRMALD